MNDPLSPEFGPNVTAPNVTAPNVTAPGAAEVTQPTTTTDPELAAGPAHPSVIRPISYLEAPTPPRRRSNRAVGVLLAVAAALIFAALFAVAIAIIVVARRGGELEFTFLGNTEFYVPVLFFLVGFVLLVIIVNRARWWAHVFGSIFVALFVYFGTIGTLLLINGVTAHTPGEAGAMFSAALVDPLVVAATLIAREVALWFGFAISARGRRLTVRNSEERAAYETALSAQRAEYDRVSTASA